MDQNAVAVKIGFNGDLHRLRVDLNSFTLQALTQLFARTFGLAPGAFVIKYTDAEGDTLNVCSDAEFVEACRVFLSGNSDELKALKFTAVARDAGASIGATGSGGGSVPLGAPSTSSNPADPLLAAVERLVVTLNHTVDKVRQEEWKGVDDATEALSQAATDAKLALEAARASVQEKPFEAVLEETSDGLKSAASGISSFAQRFVKSFIPEKKPEPVAMVNQPPSPVAAEEAEAAAGGVAQPEEKAEETPAVEDAPVAVAPAAAGVAEPEVVVPGRSVEVAFSDDEIKWADQLSMIRGVFPDVAVSTAIQLLENHDGDVNIVINELMEEMM